MIFQINITVLWRYLGYSSINGVVRSNWTTSCCGVARERLSESKILNILILPKICNLVSHWSKCMYLHTFTMIRLYVCFWRDTVSFLLFSCEQQWTATHKGRLQIPELLVFFASLVLNFWPLFALYCLLWYSWTSVLTCVMNFMSSCCWTCFTFYSLVLEKWLCSETRSVGW